MTNEMIIMNERVRLMEEGKIKSTGRVIILTDGEGNEKELPEPEQIHTFQAWKERGKSVKKGEHAITRITIWKCSKKNVDLPMKDVASGETVTVTEESKNMFMKCSAFFAESQVEDDKRAG